jgi:prepilin-type N-terminal cleavage/methylation domain-containing protein
MSTKNNRPAFTLIEIIICIAIVGLVSAIIFAAFGPAKSKARESICIEHLRQISLALSMYRQDYDGMDIASGEKACVAMGLPCTNPQSQLMPYTKNKDIWFCPDFHGFYPDYDTSGNWGSHYGIRIRSHEADEDIPDYAKFSKCIEKQNEHTPIVIDENHNRPFNLMKEPRWITKKILILRLSGQVSIKIVPLRSVPSDGNW